VQGLALALEWVAWRLPMGLLTAQINRVRKMSAALKGNARPLALFNICWTIPNFFAGLYMGPFLAEQGLTKIQIGTLATAGNAAMMVGALCGGWMADRLGRLRTIMIVDALVWPAAFALYAFGTGYWTFLAASVLVGSVMLLNPAWISLYLRGARRVDRPYLFGFLQIIWFGGGIIASFSGFLVRAWGVSVTCRWVFFGAMILTAVSVWVRRIFLHDPTRVRERMKPSIAEFGHIFAGHLYAARMMMKRRELLIFLLIQVLIQSIISIGATFNNLYFIDKRGVAVPAEALAVLPLFSGITVIATSFIIVPFITPASVMGFLILGTTLLSVQIYLFLLAPAGSVAVLIGAVVTGSFGWALFNPALSGTWANLISDRDRPRLVAFSNVVVFGLAMIGPAVGGILYTVHPRGPLVLNLALYGALMACILWAALHSIRPRNR